jgi:hypothetical protein
MWWLLTTTLPIRRLGPPKRLPFLVSRLRQLAASDALQNQYALTYINLPSRSRESQCVTWPRKRNTEGQSCYKGQETNRCQCSQANSVNHLDVDATQEGQLTQTRMSLNYALTDPLRRAREASPSSVYVGTISSL